MYPLVVSTAAFCSTTSTFGTLTLSQLSPHLNSLPIYDDIEELLRAVEAAEAAARATLPTPEEERAIKA